MKRIILILLIAAMFLSVQNSGTPLKSRAFAPDSLQKEGIIHLKYAAFNPLMGEPEIRTPLKALPDNPVKLVKVTGPMTSDWILDLERKGAVILSYLQEFTYIMALDLELESYVAALPEVLWIGDFHPAYKIQEGLMDRDGRNEVNILLWTDFSERKNKEAVIRKIRNLQIPLTFEEEGLSVLRAKVTDSEIMDLARMPGVHWIDRWDPPQKTMNFIREFTGADMAASQGGFDGSGIVGEVKDNGCDLNHPDFGNLLGTHGNVSTQAHGTCTFGIVFSDQEGNAKGMMPGGGGVFADWYTSRSNSISYLKSTYGGVFQSNSWSQGSLNGDYTSYSSQNDQAVSQYDVLMLYAAGNSDYGVGSKTITQDSAAKNVISVGAIWHHNTSSLSDDEWHSGGPGNTPSQGPARDNRIKPDLCGVFDAIYTTDVRGGGGYSGGDYTGHFGGTSGATPIVAGGAGLVYQMYKQNHFGNNPVGDIPHNATVKALLIANAKQYLLTRANRYQQGWGLVDVAKIYEAGNNQFIEDGSVPLATGETVSYTVQRADASTPLKIVLCWTDKAGETSASQALINDLDVKVTAPDSTVYYGNAGLVNNLYSSAGGVFDRLNNVECVFIQQPLSGDYQIEVIAYNIAQDTDPGAGVKQAFSLVASETYSEEIVTPTIIAGAGPGPSNAPLIQGFRSDGSWNGFTDFEAFSPGMTYGVKVAAGDLQNDEKAEIIAGMGPGEGQPARVRAFTMSGTQISGGDMLAYGTPSWGVNIHTGDIDGDGQDEIITGSGEGGGYRPHVRAWKYQNGALQPVLDVSFLVSNNARWGIHVAAADIDGDGYKEIITGAGPGPRYGPHVRAFNYDGDRVTLIEPVNFFAYNVRRFGVKVSGGDVEHTGKADIITAPGRGPVFGPHIRGFYLDGDEIKTVEEINFFAYNPSLKYGATVNCGDMNNDGKAEILTGPGPGNFYGPHVRVWEFTGSVLHEVVGFFAFQGTGYKYGAYAAAGNL